MADDVTHYLQSVSRLLQLGSSVRTLDASLREFLVRRNERALKTVVAVVDSLFMLDHQGDDSRSSENWKHYTKEDLAEAGSDIIHCFMLIEQAPTAALLLGGRARPPWPIGAEPRAARPIGRSSAPKTLENLISRRHQRFGAPLPANEGGKSPPQGA